MYAGITRAEQNLLLLQSMIPEGEKLYIWCYDAEGRYIASSCPEPFKTMLTKAFDHLGALQKVLSLVKQTDGSLPRVLGSAIGMQWAVTFEEERKKSLIFVIGPVFYTAPREKPVRSALYSTLPGPEHAAWIHALCAALPEMPVMPYAVFSRYVLMVHNTLTGQQLGLEALGAAPDDKLPEPSSAGQRDRDKVYLSEKAMLQMVREGNINYYGFFRNSAFPLK